MPATPASPETKKLIETLYQISINDIAQLKNRQWDVTKWVLAANVGLLIPIVIGTTPPEPGILRAIAALSAGLAFLAIATILKTQCSLAATRGRQRKWRCRHRELGKANMIAGKKKGHESFCYDWQVWLPMLLIALGSSCATVSAAGAALP